MEDLNGLAVEVARRIMASGRKDSRIMEHSRLNDDMVELARQLLKETSSWIPDPRLPWTPIRAAA